MTLVLHSTRGRSFFLIYLIQQYQNYFLFVTIHQIFTGPSKNVKRTQYRGSNNLAFVEFSIPAERSQKCCNSREIIWLCCDFSHLTDTLKSDVNVIRQRIKKNRPSVARKMWKWSRYRKIKRVCKITPRTAELDAYKWLYTI